MCCGASLLAVYSGLCCLRGTQYYFAFIKGKQMEVEIFGSPESQALRALSAEVEELFIGIHSQSRNLKSMNVNLSIDIGIIYRDPVTMSQGQKVFNLEKRYVADLTPISEHHNYLTENVWKDIDDNDPELPSALDNAIETARRQVADIAMETCLNSNAKSLTELYFACGTLKAFQEMKEYAGS
jgi:hypothetical protein